MPLVRSFTLSKKKGKEAYIEPEFHDGHFHYTVKTGKHKEWGTVERNGAHCAACNTSVPLEYIREEGRAHRLGQHLMAIVAEGQSGRVYLSPNAEQARIANVPEPADAPDSDLPEKALGFRVQAYGMTKHKYLFTNRQLTALTTFSELVGEAQRQAEADALAAGRCADPTPLCEGGSGAHAYGEAVGVYLAFGVDRESDFCNSVCRWSVTNEKPMNLFARQAIPMVWDYPEVNVFSNAVGSFSTIIDYISKCIVTLPFKSTISNAVQFDAQSDCGLRGIMVSTDPPYYDNIGYADLSDFFYVWMRQALKRTYPNLFRTMLVPKAEELVATPYRFEGSVEKARNFFEDGMFRTCRQLYQYTREDVPVTIYYAFKQSETDEDDATASTGWETMLSAIIRAGFSITGTWPIRTEQTYRSVGMGTNALASSIVLVCRKRAPDAGKCTRREFINALHRELRPALIKLQSANIAPVDLAQSAIGPGIGVFSRYQSVLESDGRPMSVRAALQIINQELDAFYNEQEGELDRDSRFCVELFSQYAFNTIKFGDADILARAKNTSVQALADRGVLAAAKGQVRLLPREETPEAISVREECVWLLTQQLARAMETGGVQACAVIVAKLVDNSAENAKALAYRLYTVCERKKWAQEGAAYNDLVVAWPDIQARAADLRSVQPQQTKMDI